jgi:hypothetical protein
MSNIKDQKVRILDTDSDNIGLNVVQLGAVGAMPVRIVDSLGVGVDTLTITNTDIATIAGAVSGNEMQVDIVSMPAISVTASVDTTGLATEAKQNDTITAIQAIPGGGGTQYTEGDTDATITGTAILHEIAANTLATISATNPLPISDNGGTITVDGTVAVTGTFWQATQPVSLAASVAVTNADITSCKTALEIMDDWDDSNYCNMNMNIAGTDVSANAGVLTAQTLRVTIATDDEVNNSLASIDGKITACNTGAVVVSSGTITSITNAVAVTGTFWQATQPISGTVTTNTHAVYCQGWKDSGSAYGDLQLDASSNLIIAGTVTANLSATDNAVLDSLDTKLGTIDTAIDAINAKLVTGTVIGDVNLGATDNAVLDAIALGYGTEGDALADGILMQGDDGTDRTNVLVDTDGHIQVDVLSGGGAGEQYADNTLVNAAYKANLVAGTDGSNYQILSTDASGHVQVDVLTAPSTAVTNVGTFAVQATLAAETTKVIGTVNVAASQTIAVTQATAGNLNCTEASASAIKTAVEAIDNAVDGNYLNANLNCAGTDIPPGGGAEATALRVTIANDSTGLLSVDDNSASLTVDNTSIDGPGKPTIDSYTHLAINLAAGANQLLVSSAANKQIWVYAVSFVCSAAGTVSFQDEDDTAISGIMPFAANSGMAQGPSGNFAMPLWKLATDHDLEVDIVTAEVDGFLTYAIVSV